MGLLVLLCYVCIIFQTWSNIQQVNGQFTLTGFPYAEKGTNHTLTCNYPGATAYAWRSPYGGRTTKGAEINFNVDSSVDDGLWKCEATVGGDKKIISANLLVYCPSLYSTSASNTIVAVGDPIRLYCELKNPKGKLVSWIHRSFRESTDTGVAYVDNKCHVTVKEQGNTRWQNDTKCNVSRTNKYFNLIIDKVGKSNVGYWRCKDFGDTGCWSEALRIDIANPPKDPPVLTGFNNPIVGANHVLTCNAWQPFTRPMYSWYKDGHLISSGNASAYTLKPVVRAAAGKYRCEVFDEITRGKVEAEDTLTVFYTAIWNPAFENEARHIAQVGQNISLTLDILAYPLPTSINWYFEWNPTSPLNKNKNETTWTIRSVTLGDYGEYTAEVTNQVGKSFFNFEIAMISSPDPPTDVVALTNDKNSMSVWFTAGFDGGSPQTFTIELKPECGESEFFSGIQERLGSKMIAIAIDNLLEDTPYYITVKAVNSIGSSSYTDTITKQTGGIPRSNGKDVAVQCSQPWMPNWQMALLAMEVLAVIVISSILIFFSKKWKNRTSHGETEQSVTIQPSPHNVAETIYYELPLNRRA